MFLTMFFKTQNIVPTMHLTMLITHPYTLEAATRAKKKVILIAAEAEEEDYKKSYADYQKYFQDAADKGLVELMVCEEWKWERFQMPSLLCYIIMLVLYCSWEFVESL